MRYLDPQQLKRELALEYVCAVLAGELGTGALALNENLEALCPFHQDSEPSFRLWDADDHKRWHCFPCGEGGDVYDLLMRVRQVGFTEATLMAERMLGEAPEQWRHYEAPIRVVQELDHQEVMDARVRAQEKEFDGWLSVWAGFTRERDPAADLYLRTQWGWGCDDFGNIFMPHWTQDGNLTGCKVRWRARGAKGAIEGSRFTSLYGAWRPRLGTQALLTEGETDAIWGHRCITREGLNCNIYGLPRGAQSEITEEMLRVLQGLKIIFLAFDPDAAGVAATVKWIEMLHAAGHRDVRVCRLPQGKDLRAARPSITRLLEDAIKPKPVSAVIGFTEDGIFRQTDRNPRQLTSWTIEPTSNLAAPADDEEGAPGYEVKVVDAGVPRDEVISTIDLTSGAKFKKWCAERGLVYQGADADTSLLGEWVAAKAAVLPEVFQSERVGLRFPPDRYHYASRTLVLPDTYLGDLPWRFTGSRDVAEKILVPTHETVNWDWGWLDAFFNLNEPKLMHPIIAWFAAAARRPDVKLFPMLFLGGSSGVGKTTIAQLGCQLFGSNLSAHLGQSTPFVLMKALSASTSFPVFIDEWTLKSRQDTLQAFQGTIPILYEGGTAQRGTADQILLNYRMTAPVVIAGEHTFDLDRETERMIILNPRRSGQNPDQLHRIAGMPVEGFSRIFYSWLLLQRVLPPLDRSAVTRPDHNRGVLVGGWETMRAFLAWAESLGEDVPTLPEQPDLSALDEANEVKENVYETALHEGFGLKDNAGDYLVWPDPDGRGTWVRFAHLVPAVQRATDLDLPGGYRAMRSYFGERYSITEERAAPGPYASRSVRASLVHGFFL